jgi:16S rRNA (guanine1516-N2)-methyltransferase
MPLISPSDWNNIKLRQRAERLSYKWSLELIKLPQADYYLQLTPERLQLIANAITGAGPIYVDFTTGAVDHRRRFGGGKGQIIAKAAGLNKLKHPLILDATAGMGKDAFVFASLGARVILMERSSIAAALLEDGLNRAGQDSRTSDIIARMQLLHADARNLSPVKPVCEQPDVVYLDPMFPHRKKSALVKKEMRAFQHLIGDDDDSDQLLSASLGIARKRVVVKRPNQADFLNHQKPDLSLPMKKHRFDIYLT